MKIFTIPETTLEIFQRSQENEYILNKRFKKSHQSTINYNQDKANEINSLSITENEIIEILGRKWKSNLAVIGGFIEKYQYITSEKDVSAIPVASTGKFMISLCGSQKNASNLIQKMCKIHLLTKAKQEIDIENLSFDDFGNLSSSVTKTKEIEYSFIRGLCCSYYYSKKIQNIIKETITKNKIVIKSISDKQYKKEDIDTYISKVETFDFDKIRFNSKLSIPCTEKDMDKYVFAGLYQNYPQLETYQKMADEMNETLNAANKISFQPNIKFSKSGKYISKIGIRATNTLVSAKKENDENKNFHGKYKTDVLKEQLGDTWYEFDVKSSVPRVTMLLNTGKWINNDIDIYEQIYKRMREIISHYTKVETFNLPETFDKDTRKLFKSMFMRGYFDNENSIANHILPAVMGEGCGNLAECDYDEYRKGCEIITKFVSKVYVKAIEDILGKRYDSEIFLHESCIYMEVAKVIRDRGIKLVQIYDGFYTDKEISDIEQIIKEISERYYQKYIKSNENIDTYTYISKVETFDIERHNNISNENIDTYTYISKVETFDIEPITLLKKYTLENVPYDIWHNIEPNWNIFVKTYGVLLNKKKGA